MQIRITRGIKVILAGILAASLALVAAGQESDPLLEKSREAALPVAKSLMERLEGRLMEAMKSGGPAAAITVCEEQALELTEAVRANQSVTYLKRVGVRLRNPANAPDPAEQRALQHFLADGPKKGAYPADWVDRVTLPDGTEQVRYYRAIPMQSRCLLCHGPESSMPELVREQLDRLYPDDAARNFQLGELRGLLVVGLDSESLD